MNSPHEELVRIRIDYVNSTAIDNATQSETKDTPQIANNRRYVDWLKEAEDERR